MFKKMMQAIKPQTVMRVEKHTVTGRSRNKAENPDYVRIYSPSLPYAGVWRMSDLKKGNAKPENETMKYPAFTMCHTLRPIGDTHVIATFNEKSTSRATKLFKKLNRLNQDQFYGNSMVKDFIFLIKGDLFYSNAHVAVRIKDFCEQLTDTPVITLPLDFLPLLIKGMGLFSYEGNVHQYLAHDSHQETMLFKTYHFNAYISGTFNQIFSVDGSFLTEGKPDYDVVDTFPSKKGDRMLTRLSYGFSDMTHLRKDYFDLIKDFNSGIEYGQVDGNKFKAEAKDGKISVVIMAVKQ